MYSPNVRTKNITYTIPGGWGFNTLDAKDLLYKLELVNKWLFSLESDKATSDCRINANEFEYWAKGQKAWLEQLIETLPNYRQEATEANDDE